jgi:21S rRNA (GM2251-2'-O)-methyltransferase
VRFSGAPAGAAAPADPGQKFLRVSEVRESQTRKISSALDADHGPSPKLEMPAIVLSKGFQSLRIPSVALRFYHVGKASSVNTAIARGIRKSKGLGFRGKEKTSENDPRKKYIERNGLPRFTADPKPFAPSGPQMTRGWEGKRDNGFSKGGTSATTALRIRRGKKEVEIDRDLRPFKEGRNSASGYSRGAGKFSQGGERRGASDRPSIDRPPFSRKGGDEERDRSRPSYSSQTDRGSLSRPLDRTTKPYSYESGLEGRSNKSAERYPSLSRREPLFGARSRESRPADKYPPRGASSGRHDSGSNLRDSRSQDRIIKSTERYPSIGARRPSFESRSQEIRSPDRSSEQGTIGKYEQRSSERSASRSPSVSDRTHNDATEHSSNGSRITQTIDNRIPLSIPYTTTASEFLYGTSVVEAALSSRRIPRRKLYKLYIYNGENREKGDQDADIERLARKNGVEVARVGGDWLRLLDKMSAGRPHNGYILEASPLPRLPITSLGQLTDKDGQNGFEVVIDYQSREEAVVNGTDSFIRVPKNRSERKPLVLFLDSIVDPGNLGGIIRTAAFLGVTAIGVSTRNSAPFSPVVLKASAGASENVTLFSVNKPSGFVVNSKAAGWKVFAAVAPSKKQDPNMPMSISTDELEDPLSKDPCILMLGSEGEGLRWNLRSKADADLYIQGSDQSHNVDSLNVSVATGILCESFLRGRNIQRKETSPFIREGKEEADSVLKGDLF